MKSIFNKSWVASKQPRKQVKFRANAPNHIRRKFMGSLLDKAIRKRIERRTLEVRKGDEVKIMRGKFKGKIGKVSVVDVGRTRVQVEGSQRAKMGGEKLETWFHPSNLMIITLEETDSKRIKTSKKGNVETPKKSEDKKSKSDKSESEVKKSKENKSKNKDKESKKK